MKGIIKYSLLNAYREGFLVGFALVVVSVFALSWFLGETLLIENREAWISFFCFTSRLLIIIGISGFVVHHMTRTIESNMMILFLTASRSKTKILWGFSIGLMAVLGCMILPVILLQALLLPMIELGIWSFSLYCEGIIIGTFALLLGVYFHHPAKAFIMVMSFYCLSRGSHVLQQTLDSPFREDMLMDMILRKMLHLFPQLHLFAQTEWIFGPIPYDDVVVSIVQTIVFSCLFLLLGIHFLARKAF